MSPPSRVAGRSTGPSHPREARTEGWPLAAAMLLAAVNLRPAVASVGPVLTEIRQDLGLSAAAASVLTALPVLCFGVGALVAPPLARRFGSEVTLGAVLGITTIGLLLRLGPSPGTLFAGTFLAGAAIAVANVLIPAMIKRLFVSCTGLMMGLYVFVMAVTASGAAAVTVPVSEALPSGWRAGLGLWSLPAAAAFAVWLAVSISRRRRAIADDRTTEVPTSLLGDAVAWHVTLFMGLQSLGFYTMLAWLPSVYRSHGLDAEVAGQLLSLLIVLGAPIALFVPSLLTRSAHQSRWSVGSVLVTACGMFGLLLAPTWLPLVWTVLIGIGMGASFPLALTLVVLRSRDAEDAAQLSAMSHSAGYALAALGPLVFGILHDLSGGWTVPVGFLLLLLVPQSVAGARAGRTVYVGQAIADAHRR